jgi:hypothetical protein
MISKFLVFHKVSSHRTIRYLAAIELELGKNGATFVNFSLIIYVISGEMMNRVE